MPVKNRRVVALGKNKKKQKTIAELKQDMASLSQNRSSMLWNGLKEKFVPPWYLPSLLSENFSLGGE